ALPQLHCNGKCILAQKLGQAAAQSTLDAPVPPEGPQLEDFLLGQITHQVFVSKGYYANFSLAADMLPYQAPTLLSPTPPPWTYPCSAS
ncbi:MAG: hypothetical protein AAF804_16860, partial [Bacteroidota bacterium]